MPHYIVKVKKAKSKTYLWGGAGIKTRLYSSLFFTFRVMDMGESIIFGIYKALITGDKPSEEIEIGILKENETFTIQLKDVTGIYAQCYDSDADTKVECFIECLVSND